MINALSNKLKELGRTENGEFKSILKQRLNGKVTDEQAGAIKEFIFLMPPVLKTLIGYWKDSKTPAEVKKLGGLLNAYILRRDDLISDEKLGLFGYLDDSYIVVSTFLKIQDKYLRNWQEKSKEELELAERARRLINAPKIVIPEEASKIDEVIELFERGQIASFEEYLAAR